MSLFHKIQRPEISTKIEFSKAFDTSNEAVSLSGNPLVVKRRALKREVELEEETTRKLVKRSLRVAMKLEFLKPEAMTFNQCTFIISKD